MKRMTLIAAAIVAAAGVASQPAAAYELTTTGRTLASPRLAADVLSDIARYSKATGGCSFIFSADMRVVPGSFTANGGHSEVWSLNACAARQRFRSRCGRRRAAAATTRSSRSPAGCRSTSDEAEPPAKRSTLITMGDSPC